MTAATIGGEPGGLEQGERRDQVDEGGHRLGGVQDGPENGLESVAARGQDADDDADQQRQNGRDEDVGKRRHRVRPEPEQDDQDETDAGGDRRPAAGQEPGDRHHDRDDEPPWRGGQDRLERIEDEVGRNVLDRNGGQREVRGEPVDEPVDRVAEGDGHVAREACRVHEERRERCRRRGSRPVRPSRRVAGARVRRPPRWVRGSSQSPGGVRQAVEDDGEDHDREPRVERRRRRRSSGRPRGCSGRGPGRRSGP